MVRVMNLQKSSEGSCGSSFLGQEVEIRVKEGGTGLHKTIRKINLVYKGLKATLAYSMISLILSKMVMTYVAARIM